MSNFSFMDGLLEYFSKKAEVFLKDQGIDKTVADFEKDIKFNKPEWENINNYNQAMYIVFYIEELMTAILNYVSFKNGTSIKDEREKFLSIYLSTN